MNAGQAEIEISGAGPAGLAAALVIAKAGGRAVVHEHNADVGGRFHGGCDCTWCRCQHESTKRSAGQETAKS